MPGKVDLAVSIGISPRQPLLAFAEQVAGLEAAGAGRVWLIDSQLAPLGIQDQERRRHRHEDAGEQDRDFVNRPETEPVIGVNLLRRGEIRRGAQQHQQPFLHLGTHGTGLALLGVIKPRFLVDLAAIFQNTNLAARFIFNGLPHEANGIHILDFAARSKVSARLAHRHIHIGPHRALLHIAIASAEIAHDLAQLGDIGLGLIG